jgi:hypothetical protein
MIPVIRNVDKTSRCERFIMRNRTSAWRGFQVKAAALPGYNAIGDRPDLLAIVMRPFHPAAPHV